MDSEETPAQTPSDLINVKQFLVDWCALLTDEDVEEDEQKFQEYVKNEMGISQEMTDELEAVCGEATLNRPNEPQSKSELLEKIPADSTLATHGLHKEHLKRRNASNQYRGVVIRKFRYRIYEMPWLAVEEMKALNKDKIDIQLPEVLLTVHIYRPYITLNKGIKPNEEYIVFGQQTLTELRDKIMCTADTIPIGEHSDNPDLVDTVTAKDMFTSGFFYIENTFYNDMRDESARDYSEVIRDWSSKRDRGLGPYESKKMEETTFLELNIRLGHPYLYMHQGSCEHLIVFTDIRLLHSEDCQNARHYPIRLAKHPTRKTHCRACHTAMAKWLVFESNLSPEDPCFYCDTCFRSLHYNSKGEKVSNFRAYIFPESTISWSCGPSSTN